MRFGWLSPTGWKGGARAAVLYAGISAAGANVLRWIPGEAGSGTLIVPMKLGLPSLHDRAATLATGLRPARGQTGLKYQGVPADIARRVARSLGQSISDTGM